MNKNTYIIIEMNDEDDIYEIYELSRPNLSFSQVSSKVLSDLENCETISPSDLKYMFNLRQEINNLVSLQNQCLRRQCSVKIQDGRLFWNSQGLGFGSSILKNLVSEKQQHYTNSLALYNK